jgi:Zn-finger nucleic acid-binding protein
MRLIIVSFVIDLCAACSTVWLDKGEIMAIALSPGGDREA